MAEKKGAFELRTFIFIDQFHSHGFNRDPGGTRGDQFFAQRLFRL